MLEGDDQRRLAQQIRPKLAAGGIDVVFVGSTAIVARNLFPRTSKDADALANPETTLEAARAVLQDIARAEGLDVVEKGRGTVSLVKRDANGNETWAIDLIVPAGGLIPPRAAIRIRQQATETDFGPTATVEHIVAMKAIAYGDCNRDDRPDLARNYENDLLQLRDALPERIAWTEVRVLLAEFPTSRRRDAAAKVFEVFGEHVGDDEEADPGYG